MSGSTDPSRVPGLPGLKPTRRLGPVPLAIAGGLSVGVVGVIFALLLTVQEEQRIAGSAASADFASARPEGDFLAGEDPSLLRAVPAAAPAAAPVDTPRTDTPRAGSGSPPNVHEQARLAAWQQYYQGLADQQQQHRQALQAAMATPLAPQQQPQGQQGGQAQLPPIPGLSGAAAPAAPRPGTLDQGPASAGTLYLATAPVPALSPYELKRAVSGIPFRLDQDITTGAAGQFSATVTAHVMDYAGGNHILIPAGARLVGVYEDATTPSDERMRVAIVSITYPPTGNPYCPGGEELPVGSMPAGDGTGRAGLRDQVDRHTGRRLYNALIRLIGGTGPSLAGMAAGGGAGAAGALASQAMMQGGMALSGGLQDPGPTFTVRAGYRGVLQLTRSIAFEQPWQPGLGFCGGTPAVGVL